MSGTPPAPFKRMRLGTKSCAECRRRKVRCVYTGNNSACRECIAHEAICTMQQPKRNAAPPNGDHNTGRLQQRLDELEGMMRRVCEAITPNSESLCLSQLETQAITRLRSESNSQHKEYESPLRAWSQPETVNWSSTGHVSTPPADVNVVEEDAPLLRLFKQAMTVQWDRLPAGRERPALTADTRVRECVAALQCLIPTHNDLTLILTLTEHLWPIWPWLPTFTAQGVSPSQQLRPVAMAREFIFESLGSNKPAVAAKTVLWLALCIQQLPREFEQRWSKLPTSPRHLITSYLTGAETLLAMDEELGGTIEGLEAISLKAKLYVNMGKPRKAWTTGRRGLDQALLLGLHHFEDSTISDQRKKKIWSFLWHLDRQLSLILGFPYAISESHPSLSIEHTNGSTMASVAHKLSMVAGHIAERNHNHRKVDYLATLKIAQELDECRREMPQQWWETPDPNMPLETVYYPQTLKLAYFQLQKMLHLPYMLQPTAERSFIDSRTPALEASREMVKAYRMLRNYTSPMIIMCDLMDFQVFSAVLVIILNLLSQGQPPSNNPQDQTRDWELVLYATTALKHVSEVMECAVARQASQLLQHLLQAHNDSYTGSHTYEATIPYFGKVRISRPCDPAVSTRVTAGSSSLSTGTSSQPAQTTPSVPSLSYTSPPEVQFCIDPFVPFSSPAHPGIDVFSDAELNVDWTAVFDDNIDYEFNQVFDMIEPYGI
ncbi:hypothetical protein A1O3_02049 [Capronia epimyces CBS 606.96]|uniref:Zn(2)-C6 fungal-type domain-containing protein n=1 Tax=Capronia epimyces CBS 606.96 TaxID=1182542 RepID=W9YH52_9EURO|nr:uncharacterized protein A1O3_02049 [Capronia epimyces CBS 606.96]EXJ88985.1 hypothetical protein A1O3_02049 [Capronia epimyces CBS 606.96]